MTKRSSGEPPEPFPCAGPSENRECWDCVGVYKLPVPGVGISRRHAKRFQRS